LAADPFVYRHDLDSLRSVRGVVAQLEQAHAVVVDGVFTVTECAELTERTALARSAWVPAFGGEQFSLGRAFYAHFEQSECREYFADAAASDARVEQHLPGLQRRMLDFVGSVTGGVCFARRGFCGAGVHVFPAGEKVSREGGVLHFDTEGLPTHHVGLRKRALSVVVMLGAPERGGGLKVWGARYSGADHPSKADLTTPAQVIEYVSGRAIVIDSYRLHQIQPFGGARDRVSATLHAAEIDPGRWETWF
jgi:hypothetical protein